MRISGTEPPKSAKHGELHVFVEDATIGDLHLGAVQGKFVDQMFRDKTSLI
jgi:hypothetical protein